MPAPAAPTGFSVSLVDGRALTARASSGAPHATASPAPAAKPSLRVAQRVLPTDVAPQFVDMEPPVDQARLEGDPTLDPVAVSVAASSAASSASGHACQMSQWLQQALQADPQVQAALASAPRSTRSLSNAMMVWDAHWVRQAPAAVAGISVVRTAVMLGIRAAPLACQIEPVRGPELIILDDPTGTTLLAIGSGEWRWADLLATDGISQPQTLAALP